MTIRHIFVVKPLLAIAILVCLGAIITLFKLNRRRPQSRADRFLIAFIGVLTAYEGLQALKEAGVVTASVGTVFNDAIELLVATSCLAAAVMLRISRTEQFEVESALRLARAAPPRTSHLDPVFPKDASTLDALSWALPRVSDGAFKLLAVLCLRPDIAAGSLLDVQVKTGKSKDEVDRCLRELEDAGALMVHRTGTTMSIEVVAQSRRIVPVLAEHGAAPAVSESRA